MRFKLDFDADKSELPIEYRKLVLSYIKNALSKSSNGDLLDRYYTNTQTKDFTWTLIVNKPVFEVGKMKFEYSRFSIIFSTDDRKQTGFLLMIAFLNQKYVRYPVGDNNFITLKNVQQLKQKEIKGTTCRFITMPGSSIVVREHDKASNRDKYYSCEDDNYRLKLEASLRYQAESGGFPSELVSDIKVDHISGHKVVIRNYGIYLDATIGGFVLSANERILQFFYQNGICSRRSMGFGMVDIVEGDEEIG